MSKNDWKKWVSVVGRMLLAFALVFAQGAWATQNQGTKDNAASPQKAAAQQTNEKEPSVATSAKAQSKHAQGEESESVAEEKPSNDGSHQGIKVHGHWTIEVRNADGGLVRHVEFENSLDIANGNSLLTQILARQLTVGHWQIGLGGVNAVQPCLDTTGAPSVCIIAEPEPTSSCPSTNGGLTCPASNVFPTLNKPTLDANNNFVLSGQATAAMNAGIYAVSTGVHLCNPTIAPSSIPCPGTVGQQLKGLTSAFATSVASPLASVSAGQLIAVTVVISFS